MFLTILTFLASASAKTYYCNATTSCPEEYPCCTDQGECGTGSYCLGGCNPRFSFNSSACVPQPVCKSGHYKLQKKDLKKAVDYLGDSSQTNWTYSGTMLDYDDNLLLTMPKNSTGALISSTFYVWYGKIQARFKSSHNAGVVSASILYSNIKDEIDVEFIGNSLDKPQSNFYYQGVLNYTNMVNMTASDTYENWHTYEVDWKEDSITWSIDGKAQRVLQKADTWNSTTKKYNFPQTPSRVQLSIWPAGSSSAKQGVIDWAGGMVDWDASDFQDPGYLYASVDYVDVQCYDPPSGTKIDGNTSYIYKDGSDFDESDVMLTKNKTVLKNLGDTGFSLLKVKNNNESEDSSDSSSSDSGDRITTSRILTSTSLPAGYSTQFFQNIRTVGSTSSDGAARQRSSTLAALLGIILYIL